MKYEWRKQDKDIYLATEQPKIIELKKMNYLLIEGEGDPNKPDFSEKVAALFALSYAIKMLPKKSIPVPDYYEYTVFPLEGFWETKNPMIKDQVLNKDDFLFQIMIRQPDFVTEELVDNIKLLLDKKISSEMLSQIQFRRIDEGLSLQILHTGHFDSEQKSFEKLAEFCKQHEFKRKNHIHKEIYLSDLRKVAPEKLKTVLRVALEKV